MHVLLIHCILTDLHIYIPCHPIIYFQLLWLLLLLPSYLYMWFDIIHMKKKKTKNKLMYKKKQMRINVNKRKCYVAPGHLYSSISIIDFVYIVQNDCVIWYMSSGTTYTPLYSVSRWWYGVGSGIKSFLSFSLYCLYIYVCIIIVRRIDYSMMLEGVFFLLRFFLLIEMKKLWESAFSFSMYIDNPFSHTYYRIRNLSSALRKTTIILIFLLNNKLFLTSI